eukprot:750636-Hanusia_phi.AAC.4
MRVSPVLEKVLVGIGGWIVTPTLLVTDDRFGNYYTPYFTVKVPTAYSFQEVQGFVWRGRWGGELDTGGGCDKGVVKSLPPYRLPFHPLPAPTASPPPQLKSFHRSPSLAPDLLPVLLLVCSPSPSPSEPPPLTPALSSFPRCK